MEQRFSKQIADAFLLIGAALVVCIVGGAAFLIADVRHVNPLWVFLSLISVVFFAGITEDYRNELRSGRFILFVCGWLVINIVVIVAFLGLFGWLYLIAALLLEQFFFYLSAYWLFGLRPPLKRRAE